MIKEQLEVLLDKINKDQTLFNNTEKEHVIGHIRADLESVKNVEQTSS